MASNDFIVILYMPGSQEIHAVLQRGLGLAGLMCFGRATLFSSAEAQGSAERGGVTPLGCQYGLHGFNSQSV